MDFKLSMEVIGKNSIFIKNNPFARINKPREILKNGNVVFIPYSQNNSVKFNPVYFHPSFSNNARKILKFNNLLNKVLEDPKNITLETLSELNNLFKYVFTDATKDQKALINTGRNSKVYRIDDKYVFKTDTNNFFQDEFEIMPKNEFFAKLKTWDGAVLARFGKITILKNAASDKTALPIGICYNMEKQEGIEESYYNKKILPLLAKLPQSAFDEIAGDIKTLNSSSPVYYFDYINPNNFLIVGDKIRIVDDIEKKPVNGCYNNLASMFRVFITNIQAYNRASFNENLIPQRRNIFKKCVLASERMELPFGFISYEKSNIEMAKRLAGYTTMNDNGDSYKSFSLIKDLRKFRKEIPNIDERMEKTEEYLDNLNKIFI